MITKKLSVIAHGGAGSNNEHSDGTEKAVQACYTANQNNAGLLHAVAQAVVILEDDGRYNAGKGSHARENGKVLTDGGRVLGVTAMGSDINQAIKNAYSAVDKIKWDGIHYRKDIGNKAK